jgi:hypothetical protein
MLATMFSGKFSRDVKNHLHFYHSVEFSRAMAYLTRGHKRDFARQVAELVTQYEATLTAAGFAPAQRLSELKSKNTLAETKRAAQVAAEEAARKATAESVETESAAYEFASSTVDLMVAVLGRDDELSRILRNLRDQMTNEEARGKDESPPATQG